MPKVQQQQQQQHPKCQCCPYGYHIDLDFVQYCESFAAQLLTTDGQRKRRDRRQRQRKSMEVMLGFEHIQQMQQLHNDKCQQQLLPPPVLTEVTIQSTLEIKLKKKNTNHFYMTKRYLMNMINPRWLHQNGPQPIAIIIAICSMVTVRW